jgi:hypothetical protein
MGKGVVEGIGVDASSGGRRILLGGDSLARLRVGNEAFVEERESTVFTHIESSQRGGARLMHTGGAVLPF